MVKLAVVVPETLIVRKGEKRYPCVTVFARDEEGKRRKWTTAYWPYLYLKEKDYVRLKDEGFKFNNVIGTEGVDKRSLGRRALTKLILSDSKFVTTFTHLLAKHQDSGHYKDPIYTYEADLSKPGLLALRYMIDKGIRSGFNLDERSGEMRPIEFSYPLRKWYLDLESYVKKQCSFGPKRNIPVTMFSYWDSYDEDLTTAYVVNPKWKRTVEFKPKVDKHKILPFKKESQIYDYIVEDVKNRDPDLFTAWNLDRYDIVKWKQRMEVLQRECMYSFKDLSPIHSLLWNRRPYRIKGRILFDLLKAFKRFTDAELRSYSLMYVTESEGFALEKIPFKGSAGFTWDKYPDIVYRRNVNDVLIIKALDEKYGLIEMFDDLKREFGALFHEILMNYRVLDTALMRFIHGKKIVLGTARKGKGEKDKFLGAVVIEPKRGPYSWLAQFDFSREYPNIIRLFNISPETYRDPDYKGDCYVITYGDFVYKFVKSPAGLLPQLIESFFKKRDKYEKEYIKAIESKDEVKMKVWWRRIFNIKKMTNAIYGVMDFPSFRLYRKECSAATAAIGRLSIEELQRIAKKVGYEITYGDTDSIFIKLFGESPETCVEEGQALSKSLNNGLAKYFTNNFAVAKAPSSLGLKQVYSKFLLFAKKSYAGKFVWDEKKGFYPKDCWNFKGMEIIRSDSSDLEKNAMETIIKMYLNDESLKETIAYRDKVLKVFGPGEHGFLEVAYPLQLKKSWKEYLRRGKNNQDKTPAHVRAALYCNRFLNTDYEKSDKPRRLPIFVDKKKRVVDGQMTLFNEKIYPTIWEHEDRKWLLKDISVAEDMEVPEWFLDRIDWDRIYERLEGKLNRIVNLLEAV